MHSIFFYYHKKKRLRVKLCQQRERVNVKEVKNNYTKCAVLERGLHNFRENLAVGFGVFFKTLKTSNRTAL